MTDRISLPIGFRSAGEYKFVVCADPEHSDLSASFFSYGLPAGSEHRGMRPFSDWLDRNYDRHRDFGNLVATFHVSRCGSTLLANNLRTAEGMIMLSEPTFCRILRPDLLRAFGQDTAIRGLQAAIGMWSDWAASQGKRLGIKFNSQTGIHARALMEALRGARFVFLHREPLPVLESIARGRPAFLAKLRGEGPFPLGDELSAIADDPVLKAATAGYCAALDTFHDLDQPDLMAVGYGDLGARFPAICRHLRLPRADHAVWDDARDAKGREEWKGRSYAPIGEQALAEFYQSHGELVTFAERRYAAYLDRSKTRELKPAS